MDIKLPDKKIEKFLWQYNEMASMGVVYSPKSWGEISAVMQIQFHPGHIDAHTAKSILQDMAEHCLEYSIIGVPNQGDEKPFENA